MAPPETGDKAMMSTEDTINRIIEAKDASERQLLYSSTLKNKTFEIFGDPCEDGGHIKHRPFHVSH